MGRGYDRAREGRWVEPLGGYRLRVRFSDESVGEHDFTSMLGGGPMMEPLANPDYFRRAFIEMGVVAWPNGLDMDAIQLHREMDAAGELRRDAA